MKPMIPSIAIVVKNRYPLNIAHAHSAEPTYVEDAELEEQFTEGTVRHLTVRGRMEKPKHNKKRVKKKPGRTKLYNTTPKRPTKQNQEERPNAERKTARRCLEERIQGSMVQKRSFPQK